VRLVRVAASEPDDVDIDAFLDLVGDYPEAEVYGDRLSNALVLEICPEASWVVLLDDDGVLAGTALDSRDGQEWYVLFTGSVPRARGRGLARAVKQAAHRIAFEGGASSVRTTNEDRNERMRALNESLGYQRVSGDLRLFRSS
jgi:GNAT superfamily N-acetyltransferase